MSLIEEIKEYWNLRSSGFSDSVKYDLDSSMDAEFERLSTYTRGGEIKDILDVGCGPGFYSIIFGSRGLNVTGIDYSEKMVEEATKNAADRNVGVKFMQMDAQALEFDDCSFDLVVSRDVLWCLEHPESAYSEILRVLRPGGIAIVSDGNYYLHLHNEEYDRARKEVMKRFQKEEPKKHGHDYFNKDNVDYKIIENIAEDLPLSYEERPTWDVSVLCHLGCRDISLHVRNERPLSDGLGDLVFSFDIVFVKEVNNGNR